MNKRPGTSYETVFIMITDAGGEKKQKKPHGKTLAARHQAEHKEKSERVLFFLQVRARQADRGWGEREGGCRRRRRHRHKDRKRCAETSQREAPAYRAPEGVSIKEEKVGINAHGIINKRTQLGAER